MALSFHLLVLTTETTISVNAVSAEGEKFLVCFPVSLVPLMCPGAICTNPNKKVKSAYPL